MLSSRSNRAAVEQQLAKLINGTTLHVSSPIQLSGSSYTQAAIVTVFTDALNAYKAVDAARADVTAKILDQTSKVLAALSLEAALKAYFVGNSGKTSSVLMDFGWPLAKPAVKTVATKAAAVAKSLATRAARHTLGKKQKASIHGAPAPADASPPAPAPAAPTPTGGSASGGH